MFLYLYGMDGCQNYYLFNRPLYHNPLIKNYVAAFITSVNNQGALVYCIHLKIYIHIFKFVIYRLCQNKDIYYVFNTLRLFYQKYYIK